MSGSVRGIKAENGCRRDRIFVLPCQSYDDGDHFSNTCRPYLAHQWLCNWEVMTQSGSLWVFLHCIMPEGFLNLINKYVSWKFLGVQQVRKYLRIDMTYRR